MSQEYHLKGSLFIATDANSHGLSIVRKTWEDATAEGSCLHWTYFINQGTQNEQVVGEAWLAERSLARNWHICVKEKA